MLDPPIPPAQHPKHSIFQAHKVHRKYLEVIICSLEFRILETIRGVDFKIYSNNKCLI